MKRIAIVGFLAAALISAPAVAGENLGEVDLSAGWGLSSYTLTVQAFDDPEVEGVTCHVSDVVVGGLAGALGDDPSNASIACRQTGKILIDGATEKRWWGNLNDNVGGENVFGKTKGWLKSLVVQRFIDKSRKVLIYVVYTPKWGQDSNKNVVSTISLYAQKDN